MPRDKQRKPKAYGGDSQEKRNTSQRSPPKRRKPKVANPKQEQNAPPAQKKIYGVIFFESHLQARASVESIQEKAAKVDQLNIVIHAEGSMDEPELAPFGKVYAGDAWTIIHKRRQEDGWYEVPQ